MRGVVAIVFGLATLLWSDVTLWALVVLWSAFAFVEGSSVSSARRSAGGVVAHRGWPVLHGLVPVLLGVVLVITPGAGALAITWAIGWYALAFGAMLLTLAGVVVHPWGRTAARPTVVSLGQETPRIRGTRAVRPGTCV